MTLFLEPFSSIFDPGGQRPQAGTDRAFTPAADLLMGEEEVRLVMDVPGLGAEDLEIFDRLRGIVMSDMRPGRGDDPVRIENEYLTPESFDERQKKIAKTAVGLSMSKTQLIHWR